MLAILTSLLFALSARAADEPELRLDFTRVSLTGAHRHYTQFIDGLEVAGGERVESDLFGGRRIATANVAKRIVSRQANALVAPLHGGTLVYINIDGYARLTWRVIVEERRLERFARYFDAATGQLLRNEPLFFTAKGRVFDPNPVARLNNPSLQDANNAANAVPDTAYSVADLPGLASSGPLSGPYIEISDLDDPPNPVIDVAQSLLFDRSQPQFEMVNAYFHLDRAQRYLQSLGYSGSRQIIGYALPVDPHAANGADNSYFLPSATAGRGALYFGDGGTDDAEDSDIMLHEYGHAIEEWIAPGTFSGSPSSQNRALAEGFCDYWSFSSTYEQTLASGRDPFCLADWDARCSNDAPSERCGYPAGADCLRRVDGRKTVADYIVSESSGTEHKNGEIWSSALREIFLSLATRYGVAQGKRITDIDVIEAHFGVPSNPTFAVMANRLIEADRRLNGGADASVICSAMTLRGILTTNQCDRSPRGDLTYFQSPDHAIPIPENDDAGIVSRLVITDPRLIDKLYVRLDVAHTARGDLRITLVAPDGTEVLLQTPSVDRAPDIHVTYGIDTQSQQSLDLFRGRTALGEWKLKIADVRPRDTGTLLSWSLAIQFAGAVPLTVRPRSVGERLHVAAVAHAPSANGTTFITDLRIFNRGTRDANVTLLFTPTGADGTDRFAAIKLVVRAGEIVQFDDVVAQLFATTGTGQLELLGDVRNLVATTRTFTAGPSGTYGQFIPAVATSDASSSTVFVPQLQANASFRSNLGFAEVAGSSGVVEVQLFDANSGTLLATTLHDIRPFGHLQFPVTQTGLLLAAIRVVRGSSRILAYGSVIDNSSGDAIYVPALTPPPNARVEVAPVISAAGALGTRWHSDVWLSTIAESKPAGEIGATFVDARTGVRTDVTVGAPGLHSSVRFDDILETLFRRSESFGIVRISLPAGVVATSRITTGAVGQFVPFRSVDDGRSQVPAVVARTVLHLENTAQFRTNIGVANLGGLVARARIHVFDGGGSERGRYDVSLNPLQLRQIAVSDIVRGPLTNGRASLELLEGSGGALFYASTIDNASADPIYVPAQ